MERTYEIKPFSTRGIDNCWLLTEYTDGKITAAWGFKHREEAENFLELNVPRLRGIK